MPRWSNFAIFDGKVTKISVKRAQKKFISFVECEKFI